MDYLNEADMNGEARVETPTGRTFIPALLGNGTETVSIESVPSREGNELLVLFTAENPSARAALRVRDLLSALAAHHRGLLVEALHSPDASGK